MDYRFGVGVPRGWRVDRRGCTVAEAGVVTIGWAIALGVVCFVAGAIVGALVLFIVVAVEA